MSGPQAPHEPGLFCCFDRDNAPLLRTVTTSEVRSMIEWIWLAGLTPQSNYNEKSIRDLFTREVKRAGVSIHEVVLTKKEKE